MLNIRELVKKQKILGHKTWPSQNNHLYLSPESLIMTELFEIDKGFESYEDENIKYLEEFTKKKFDQRSGLIFVDKNEFENDEAQARKKISDPKNQSWGILESEVADMIQEKERLIRLFRQFYSSKVSESSASETLTPHQLQYIISRLVIRMKRLDCVIDTRYHSTEFLEKKTGHRYLMAKEISWADTCFFILTWMWHVGSGLCWKRRR